MSDDGNRTPLAIVDLREGPPRGKRIILDDLIRGGNAKDRYVAKGLVPVLDVGDWSGPARLYADGSGLRDGGHHRRGVRLGDPRALLNLPELLIVEEPELNRGATHLKCVLTDERARQILAHVRIHSLDDRDYGDEKRHRNDDSKKCEERADLVRSNLTECSGEDVSEIHAANLGERSRLWPNKLASGRI